MARTPGPPPAGAAGPAVLAHGAGSEPALLEAAFRGTGVRVVSWWLPGHGGRPAVGGAAATEAAALAELDLLVRATGAQLVGGVSYGAHLAARWAARCGPAVPATVTGLLLLLPAWTGPPAAVAAMTAAAAAEIRSVGLPEAARRVRERTPGWVGAAVARAWTQHRQDALVATLDAVAASPAPTLEELARVRLAAVVACLRDDPLHPLAVGRAWAAALPGARLVAVAGTDPAELGRAALAGAPQSEAGSSAGSSS